MSTKNFNQLQDKTKANSVYHSFSEYISSSTFGQRNDTSLHVGLLPIPYIDNLEKASVADKKKIPFS
ncbi:MAG TPA: hypothetical protein ACFYEF_12645 [Candidatus Wunengus sp. YC63]|uniref:hypothetical protein n=1 Tax=unclassified Candidatus Wunengus TaxID=3367695 RepID=UPI0027130D64|nr:hypothetical protein [Candidatus Brocadiales bacterium]